MLSERLRLRDIRNLSSFRLTLWFGLLFALGVLALLGSVYLLTARELSARSDRILRLEAARLAGVAPTALPAVIKIEMENSASRLNYYALRDARGHLLIGNMPVPNGLEFDRPHDTAIAGGARSIRIIALRIRGGPTLVIGRDITPLIDLRHHILLILVGSGLGIALLVLTGGFVLSLGPMRRVRMLELAGEDIAKGNLAARMPVIGRGDELDQFASIVNVMVDEVARMLAQVKDVTDVIAHDLRAPLARVRNQLVRARRLHAEDETLDAVFATALVDINTVLDRFAALLRIAELEASHRNAGFGPVSAHDLLTEAVDLYQPFAEERRIALDLKFDSHLILDGDEKLLFEAVSNLVDNAIKFTPEGGRVVISARAGPHGGMIEISDSGPGIPAAERSKVLRRFQRGDNAVGVAGSGIGLSAVTAIVHLHGFTLELADAAPGLAARIHCKAAVVPAA